MNHFKIIVIVAIFLQTLKAAPPLPDLPTDFRAEVTATLPFIGAVPGTLYFDYTQLSWRLDVSMFGQTQIDIYRHDAQPPMHYTISGDKCQSEEINGELSPMTLPPFAQFIGYEFVNGKVVESWFVNWFDFVKLNFLVGNKTDSDGKVEYFLVRNKIESFGFDLTFDFKSVVSGGQDPKLFDISKYNCVKPQPPITHTVRGYVKSAIDNSFIQGATVSIGAHSTTSDNKGVYTISGVSPGEQTLTVKKSGYFDLSKKLNVTIDILPGTSADASLSPVLNIGSYRAVLTWGLDPRDLDTHVITPMNCHLYFRNRNCISGSTKLNLDVDATQGYGPETATFSGLLNGVYRYYVYIYAPGTGSFVNSNAKVLLYGDKGLLHEIPVPTTGYPAQFKFWDVFTIQKQGDSVTINVVNQVTNKI